MAEKVCNRTAHKRRVRSYTADEADEGLTVVIRTLKKNCLQLYSLF